mgnify:CR=1 FL=1
MRTLLYAIGPMIFDSLGIIVFAVLLALGADIVAATVAGTAVAVAVVGYEALRGHKIAALQWISLASVLLAAAADAGDFVEGVGAVLGSGRKHGQEQHDNQCGNAPHLAAKHREHSRNLT